MSKFINIFVLAFVVLVVVLVTGCASAPPVYNQQSPVIKIVKESGYTRNTNRSPESVRHDPYTNLAASVRQAGPVMVTVSFQYRYSSYNRGNSRTSDCNIHVKPSDSSLFDVKRCHIDQTGNTFLVLFRTQQGEKSFDIKALCQKYEGAWPRFYSNSYIRLSYTPTGYSNLSCSYIGEDPFA